MTIPTHTIEEYKNISADVWNVFKKYFDRDMDNEDYSIDLHALDAKYKDNPRLYEFFGNLNRVYAHELYELHKQEERRLNNGKDI